MKGLFVVFEGPDGSGKTTVLKGVEKALTEDGVLVCSTREPGGTPIGEVIREMLLSPDQVSMTARTEALLYAAQRAQHLEELILPKVEEGYVLLCDRYTLSSQVYQGIARGLGMEKIREINDFATKGVTPDLTLYFQISREISLLRRTSRNTTDRLEQEADDFHRMVYEGYGEALKMQRGQVVVIDAQRSIECVIEDCVTAIQNKRGVKQ